MPGKGIFQPDPMPSVTDEELNALMQAMRSRYGLDFTNYEKSSLKRGVSRLLMKHKMQTLLELWGKILNDKTFFLQAIDDLLVNLTELFRNPDVWLYVRDQLLENIRTRPIRIWHAGCSTGEEVYTMAIILQEKGLLQSCITYGSDLSTKALNQAIRGEYDLMVLNQYIKPLLSIYPDKGLEDFFDFHDKHATIKPLYTRHIRFIKHNLVHDPVIGVFDVVFCRNVMIYFDEKLKQYVLDLLYESIREKGYLILGYYDMMPEYGKRLFKLIDMKTRVYQKI